MTKDIAISAGNISKTFKIFTQIFVKDGPKEKVSTRRGAFVNVFQGKKGYPKFKALNDVSFC